MNTDPSLLLQGRTLYLACPCGTEMALAHGNVAEVPDFASLRKAAEASGWRKNGARWVCPGVRGEWRVVMQLDFVGINAERRAVWQWHGRQAFREVRNDFRFPRRLRTVIYHLSDITEADSEEAARQRFRELFPDAQTLSVVRICDADKFNV